MAKETKRQHFIPRTYLEKFAKLKGKEYFITAIDKIQSNKRYVSNIRNVCVETDFYTLPGETKEERQLIEDFYSKTIEANYNTAYEMLINPSKTLISDAERRLIVSSIITLLYRSPVWINSLNKITEKFLEDIYKAFEITGTKAVQFENGSSESFEGKTQDESLAEKKEQNRITYVISHLKYTQRLIELRINNGVCINKIEDENEFATSDSPLNLSNLNGGHIIPINPNNMVRLPIDPKHVVLIMPSNVGGFSDRIFRRSLDGTFSKMESVINNSNQYHRAQRHFLGSDNALNNYFRDKDFWESPIAGDQKKRIDDEVEMFKQKAREAGLL